MQRRVAHSNAAGRKPAAWDNTDAQKLALARDRRELTPPTTIVVRSARCTAEPMVQLFDYPKEQQTGNDGLRQYSPCVSWTLARDAFCALSVLDTAVLRSWTRTRFVARQRAGSMKGEMKCPHTVSSSCKGPLLLRSLASASMTVVHVPDPPPLRQPGRTISAHPLFSFPPACSAAAPAPKAPAPKAPAATIMQMPPHTHMATPNTQNLRNWAGFPRPRAGRYRNAQVL